MNKPFTTPRDVCEHLYNVKGRALLENEIEMFLRCFCLPTELQTLDGRRILQTKDQLSKIFLALRKHYAKIGLTDMSLRCVEAEFKDSQTVVSMHETRLITGNIITRSPFAVLSTLKYNGETWQISNCSFAIEDHAGHNAALMSAGEPDN